MRIGKPAFIMSFLPYYWVYIIIGLVGYEKEVNLMQSSCSCCFSIIGARLSKRFYQFSRKSLPISSYDHISINLSKILKTFLFSNNTTNSNSKSMDQKDSGRNTDITIFISYIPKQKIKSCICDLPRSSTVDRNMSWIAVPSTNLVGHI